jgi:hypothetical protein
MSTVPEKMAPEKADPAKASGSQTLQRGLDLLDQVIDGPVRLAELSERMGLTRSTTHRLANALVDRGFLTFLPREGYQLGPKLTWCRLPGRIWRRSPPSAKMWCIWGGWTAIRRFISTRFPAAAAWRFPAASATAIR